MDLRKTLKSVSLDARRFVKMFRTLDREAIAANVIAGSGIEIGGLHNPLRVPKGVRVRYVDRMTVEKLRTHYPELAAMPLTPVDIIDDGERLSTLPDASEDFIIANHFLEHCEDPLHTLLAHQRVLKPGGVLFMCVPDKRFTFDKERDLTRYEDILRDFREGPEWSRRDHVMDWVKFVDGVTEPEAQVRRAEERLAEGYSIHYHVWTFETLVEMLVRARKDTGLALDFDSFLLSKGEIVMVLRRRAA